MFGNASLGKPKSFTLSASLGKLKSFTLSASLGKLKSFTLSASLGKPKSFCVCYWSDITIVNESSYSHLWFGISRFFSCPQGVWNMEPFIVMIYMKGAIVLPG